MTTWASTLKNRRTHLVTIGAIVLMCAAVMAWLGMGAMRRPPSIFDAPVDDVTGFLAGKHFSTLSIDERVKFIGDTARRFRSMSQSDSAVAAAFFAGLRGSAGGQFVNNARELGKDILLQGAREFQTLGDEKSRAEFLDRWLVQWLRFAIEITGEDASASDQQMLDWMSRQACRDIERAGGAIDEFMAQQLMDLWETDLAPVSTPREQGEIFLFFPAVREHLLKRGK
jgi:hypothetical protein